MSKTWKLEDVSDRAIEARYTFYLPSAELIAQFQVGDLVKLIFQCEIENDQGCSAERMWVEIISRDSDQFVGRLDNVPGYIPDLQINDEITFSSCHIIQSQRDDPIPSLADQYTERCFVTSAVLKDQRPVHALYREEVDAEGIQRRFSGWTLMAGDETDDYCDDTDNWHFVSLGAVLNIDDGFRALLDLPFTCEMEYLWNVQTKHFDEYLADD
ncbi:immunity protein Imm33 domain-containing protein [Undibacterium sp. Di24W]|uniref:immunity protein Imm33 domain-containing protein n=1 Tax=Undibacterium sp. Di24W TaxID=3413033 RepID=UPI003BF3538E